ncbi:hypothetical protein AAE478_008185 [Parahypoxylon ruwenzoriense]
MVWATKADIRLHLLCIFFAVGSFVWGYNVGILSSVLVHPGFIKQMGHLNPSRKGVITAIYYLGTCDLFGRRYAALTGIFVVAVGNGFECGSTGSGAYSMMIVGRIISGIGVGMLSTSVPLYQR